MDFLCVLAQAQQPAEGDVALAGGATAATILGFICLGLISLLAYFLPVFVAGMRGHQNTAAIAVLTILLGWTFLGWAIALVWSFTAVERRRSERIRHRDGRPGGGGDFDFGD